jgi:hypothetical protein
MKIVHVTYDARQFNHFRKGCDLQGVFGREVRHMARGIDGRLYDVVIVGGWGCRFPLLTVDDQKLTIFQSGPLAIAAVL